MELRCLEDDGVPNGRLILDPTAPPWRESDGNKACYDRYKEAIYSYILGTSPARPMLNPHHFIQRYG